MKIGIFYGSTTGVTEDIAKRVGTLLKADIMEVSEISKVEEYDIAIFATSTWGMGDLQDNWQEALDTLKVKNLAGKKIAFIGIGDQESFGDSFVDGIGIIYEEIKDKGIILIGQTSTDGYSYSNSRGILNGDFLGLVIDENNQSNLTDKRIELWSEVIK
ncbi:MAG: flavodoxin [Fusobacteriaceae bacterium]